MTDVFDISAWLLTQRKLTDYTQEALAKGAGVSVAAIEAWEAGAREATRSTIAKFEEIFGSKFPFEETDDEALPEDDNVDQREVDVSAWFKEQRRAHNLTQAELAKLLRVSIGAVASWESGVRKAKPRTVERFQRILRGELPKDSGTAQPWTDDDLARYAGRVVEELVKRVLKKGVLDSHHKPGA